MILSYDEILNSLIINNKDHLIDRVPSLTDEQKQKAKDFFKKYSNYENKIDWNKLKTLTWKDFESVFELANQSKSSKKSNVRNLFNDDEFRIINEDDNFIYVSPLTYEAAKFMDSYNCGGAGAKWCIGWNDDRMYWNKYRRDGDVFCLIMTKPNAQTTLYEQFRGTDAVMSNMDETDNKAMCQISENGKVTVWSQVKDAKIVSNIYIDDLSNYGFELPTDIYETIKSEVERLLAEKYEGDEITSEYGRAVRQFLIDEYGVADDVEMLYNNENEWSGNDKEWSVFTDEEADDVWRRYLEDDIESVVNNSDLYEILNYIDERWFEDAYDEDSLYYWDEMSTDEKIEWLINNSGSVDKTEEWFNVDENGDIDRTSPKFNVDDYYNEYVNDRSGTWDGYDYASEWYRETFGDFEFKDAVLKHDLFDADKYIENIMRWNDRGAEIGGYDGVEHEVKTDDGVFYIYRNA